MTWAVFYRERQSPPRFKLPLSRAILNDPAFSPDPRSHPHFPLTNAASYKALPLPPTSPPSTLPAKSNLIQKLPRRHSSLPMPEILPKSDSPMNHLKLVPAQTPRTPRKGRMKALVRRLTTRHNLDRIDELDETDPTGVGYHHNGPYEVISSDFEAAEPSLPQRHSDPVSRGDNIPHSKHRELRPRLLRPNRHRSASSVPSTHGTTGLSLNLKPGQILQQNSIYTSHASNAVSLPTHFPPRPNTAATVPRSSHPRSLPPPSTRMSSPDDASPSELPDGFQNHPSSSLHSPRERYFGDNTLDAPNTPPLDIAPYIPRQPETTVFPPPRYESSFHSSGPPRSPQSIPQSSFDPTSRKAQSTASAVPALSAHGSRRKSVQLLDGSYEPNSMVTPYASGIQNQPSESLRIRHLPKRLVMPAPLQPQPPQVQHNSAPAEATAWQNGYPDDNAFENVHFSCPPAKYTQDARLLRKRSSAFPAKTPIPDHAPMFEDDAMAIMGDSPMKAANEAEGTTERTRRRRLSKRKNDI